MNRICRLLLISILVVTAAGIARSQGTFLCLSGFVAHAPELAIRGGISASYRVEFSVVNFCATDIGIIGADARSDTLTQLFEESTTDNIRRLTFLRDTSRVRFLVRYLVLDSRLVSHSYVEATSPTELHFVFKRSGGATTRDPSMMVSGDSVWIRRTIDFKPGSQHASDILVRLFSGAKGDSVVILRNSHPDRSDDILSAAKGLQKIDFPEHPNHWRGYFVIYTVVRYLKDCDSYEEY